MDIRNTSLLFPETSDEGPLTAEAGVKFSRDVRRVTAALTGYTAIYENEDDHHFGRLEVEVSARIDTDDPTTVVVSGMFGLRDWSNEFDDPYSGLIEVAVLADLVPVAPPRPGDARGDLVVTGAEITQVIQHFRSDDHLDTSNVFPDNSIRLIAGRPTVARLYVDYDRNSGLPPIDRLSGSLTLFNPGGSTTLAPLQSITPRRDVSINRRRRDHTLNFLIPDTASVGQVNLFATVFDATDDTQTSAPFERTIQFDQQPPLRILAVGINYTGDDVDDGAGPGDLDAPTEADFVDTLEFTDRIFPIPSVTITDYRTMDYDRDVESDIDDGCDKLGDLRDAVSDFVGDSDDIVYGLFGPGLNTGSVGGCGGRGVGVGFVGRGETAAHEIGHALGRKHAPCDNITRCASPLNTDGRYPVYSGYDSDSIGEYGFDPTSTFGTVRDPATSHDVMGYSGGRWISPYTYKALMSAVPGSPISGANATATSVGRVDQDNEWLRVKQPKLFLRLDIDRDGPTLHPSFHYDALPRPVTGEPTDYILEIVGAKGRRLRRVCLYADAAGCGCGAGKDFPIRIRHAVAFDRRATGIVLYRCDEPIAEWEVPEPPRVEVDCRPDRDDPSSVVLTWDVTSSDGDDVKEDGFWSLVQWQDRFGTWRGLAPRQTATRLHVPRRPRGTSGSVRYRVLVTTGIATGVGYWDGRCGDDHRPDPPEIVLANVPRNAGTHELSRIVTATTVGGGDHRGALRWFDAAGGELARSNRLDLSGLAPGANVVTATAVGSDASVPPSQYLIERTTDDRFLLHIGNIGGDVSGPDEEPPTDHDHPHDDHHHHPHDHHRED